MGSRNSRIWKIWIGLVLLLVGYFSFVLLSGKDKTVFMPGDLTGGHHQIGVACASCHGDSFTDKDAMQEKCVECHGDQRQKPFDSHPKAKFTDPRNADRLEHINAVYCVTCHVEHQPELADKTGLTQPIDFCIHCHADVGENRPSHKDMEFNTCASAGCHNYHNSRSLYTDFLVKHMDKPDLLESRVVPEKEFASVLEEIMTYPHDRYPVRKLGLKDADAPPKAQFTDSENTLHDWLNSAHARAGANCSSCHLQKSENQDEPIWTDKPDHNACTQCHDQEVTHFMQGKHGMRLKQNLSPMTPALARLPMHADALDEELTCNSCHAAHSYDLNSAAVESCLGCHADEHSLAYKDSPHYKLWQKEISGDLPAGSGVSCATCHMPRVAIDVSDWLRRTVVQHNQNATLVPNEKMIRPACNNCHGLGFSIDALADERLIQNNFNGKPSVHIESIDLARKDNEHHLKRTGGDTD